MALPAHTLERLPQETRRNSLIGDASSLLSSRPTPLQTQTEPADSVPARLLRGELLPGAVVELSLGSAGAGGTSLGLAACRRAQEGQGYAAFIDPSASLHAPGVQRAGVELSRLIVVEPELEALGRVAVRMAESRLFGVLVIDTIGSPAYPLDVPLGPWARVVRRLALAVADTSNSVLLLTDHRAPRSVPLPVAQRIEVTRLGEKELAVRVLSDQRGRLTGPVRGAWSERYVA